jgi:signal transduction histidine kinase
VETENKIDAQKEKFVLLGEMFENIIHQFKQPLNAITTEATGIKYQYEMGIITDEELYESLDNITQRTQFLAETIDDFRDFMQEDKQQTIFKIKNNIKKIKSIVKPIFRAKGIDIFEFYADEELECNGYDREFSQVIINILNNAKDAILSKNPDEKVVKIDILDDNENIKIDIYDNAGGIPEDIIENIFEDHFSTKQATGGTGIGLFMSNTIIEEHFKGQLLASNAKFTLNENSYYGAKFTIIIPKNI